MTTDSNDIPDAGSARQATVERLARSATSALDTQDRSLSDTVVSLSDTVARQALLQTKSSARTSSADPADPGDAKWLEEIVARVTRQVVVARAKLLEVVLRSGMAAGESGADLPDETVDDAAFDVARERLTALCELVKQSLQVNEWYLFRGHYIEDTPWSQLAADLNICDGTNSPSGDAAKEFLGQAIGHLRERAVALLDRLPVLESETVLEPAVVLEPATVLESAMATEGSVEGDEACESSPEVLLTWGLTERQKYLVSRSLPWVTLKAVNGKLPAIPLKEPLLVNVADSDRFLAWAEEAEANGTPAEPVVVMLEHDHDPLPARLWSYSHGTVSPNDWSRAEDLLACHRLLECESVALSVELATIQDGEDTLMLPVSQFEFESEVTISTREHLSECVTCRVAFNQFLENRLQVWRANVAAIAPAIAAATVCEPAAAAVAAATGAAVAGAAVTGAVVTGSTAQASGAVRLPEELTRDEWLDAVPSATRPLWSLLTLTAGFVGAEPVQAILAELKQRAVARPEVLMAVFSRMLAELRRRAARPRPPGMPLASYAAESVQKTLGSEPEHGFVGSLHDTGGLLGGLSSLISLIFGGEDAMSNGGLQGRASGATGERSWESSAEQFLSELKQGIPAQADGLSFTVQLDGDAAELVLHTLKNAAGEVIPAFRAEWQRDGETVLREQSESGRLRLNLDDLARLNLDERAILRIQRA